MEKEQNISYRIFAAIIGMISYIVLGLFFLYILYFTFIPKHKDVPYTYKEIIVSEGERLWDIAEEELKSNSYYEGDEVRQIIYEIEKDNNINSNELIPGQVIKIRIKKDELSNSTDQSFVR